MLEGYSLVYFGPEPWDGLWRNRHQLLSVFARKNKVLYVEPRAHLRPAMRAVWRERSLGLRWPLCEAVQSNLFVFHTPRLVPISGNRLVAALTRSIRHRLLRETLRRLGMHQPIAWFSRPNMADLIGVCQEQLAIYHVVDEYTAYGNKTDAEKRRVRAAERRMLALTDMVVVVSPPLLEAKRQYNPNTYLVPNGVNYQAYTAALADPQLPDDLKVIKCPRLGYIGLINSKLNLNMLIELAQENPEWSLVLLGQVAEVHRQKEVWRTLQMLPNVHHLGPVEVSQVPHYVKGFQVGLMPYLQNRHAEHISPLKLYDYLAAGLPIASLDIPAAREFSQHIHLADNPQSFAQAVRAALADTTPERCQDRRNVAAQHTWEARVEQLSDLIQAQLVAKVSK